MTESYFTSADGVWFQPTGYTRGPWDVGACHAGPPTGLMVRALERLVPHQQLSRVLVELMRPIPMSGFRVQAEIRKPGRSVTLSEAEIFDDDQVYARAYAMHLRTLDHLEASTAPFALPSLDAAVPGAFPIQAMRHDELSFASSMEVLYGPGSGDTQGGPTTVWMRTKVPLLPDEEASGFQKICPLADSGNGISYNDYLDKVLFVNPDLLISFVREPEGDWFCAEAVSHWEPTGIGVADAELYDHRGPVAHATQNLLLNPAE